jgi:putative membrane protein
MKRSMLCVALVALGVYLSMPGVAVAMEKGQKQIGAADQAFAMMAASGGLEEVHLGRLAEERAASPEVKEFAHRLVQDHTKANQELLTIAEKKGISMPKELDDTHKDVVKLFSHLKDAQFDHEFLSFQVMGHEKETAAFAVQAKEGQDPDLKAFAAQQLPILKEHLQKARELAAQPHSTGTGGQPTGQRGAR